MAPESPGPEPLVSVIIPVYNAAAYVPMTLDSLRRQGLDDGQMEIIAVDDGSTDGSPEVLASYAEEMDGLRVIRQENSGGPGGPRNHGLEHARGEFVFFLDADDELAEGALAELTGVARQEGSDIVVAKMGGLNGRRPPASMFGATKLDADLVADKLFNTLSPLKLFRRDLIERVGARFPTDMLTGEDQPFTTALYLRAGKISICADREYVLIRARDDGGNTTAQAQPLVNGLDVVRHVMDTILEHTEPGELRDAVIRRPLRFKAVKLVGPALLTAAPAEQCEIVDGLADVLQDFAPEAVNQHVTPIQRIKLALCRDRDLETLLRVVEWEREPGGSTVHVDAEGFSFAFPEDLAAAIGPARTARPAVRGVVRLDAVRTSPGRLVLAASCAAQEVEAVPEQIRLELVHRQDGTVRDLVVPDTTDTRIDDRPARALEAEVELEDLSSGVWDVFLIQRFGQDELRRRLGADRSEGFPDQPVHVDAAAVGGAGIGRAYYTKGYGNISLDVGFSLSPDPRPAVHVLGALDLPRPALLLSSEAELSAPCLVDRADSRTDLRLQALSRGVHAATAEAPAALTPESWIEVTTAQGIVRRVLPAPVALPRAEPDPATAPSAAERGVAALRRLRRAPRALARRLRRRLRSR